MQPEAPLVSVLPLSNVAEGFDEKSTSLSSSPARSVSFVPQIVTGVKEIPNRYSLTKEK